LQGNTLANQYLRSRDTHFRWCGKRPADHGKSHAEGGNQVFYKIGSHHLLSFQAQVGQTAKLTLRADEWITRKFRLPAMTSVLPGPSIAPIFRRAGLYVELYVSFRND
jgi:hypothetical protein